LNKGFKKEILDGIKFNSATASTSTRVNNSRHSRDDDDDPLRVPGTGSRRPRPYPEW